MKNIFFALLSAITISANAQNLFPVKLENCKTDKFCLDCGDTKAGFDEEKFGDMMVTLNKAFNLSTASGTVKFQVLINNKGRACVLSHTDNSNSPITLKIIDELNSFKSWKPAITEGKKQEKTSVNLSFTIKDGLLTGKIDRIDMDAFEKSFDRPTDPEIFNETYKYKNNNLKNYKITSWNSSNSNLPHNRVDEISKDKNNQLFMLADSKPVVFKDSDFEKLPANTLLTEKTAAYFALESDSNGTLWLDGINNIYSYENNNGWKKQVEQQTGISDAYKIINNEATGELFFCTKNGLIIKSGNIWTTINKKKIKELPSDRVYFAKRDSKKRLWIGTFDGSILIDEFGKATKFNNRKDLLNGFCITSMTEDESGNLYFGLFEYGDENKGKVNKNEGIAVFYSNGKWKQFTSFNSGMPFNHTTDILYDNNEKVLWISTDRAGLVRYDLKDEWENYHNKNSDIPTSYISKMIFDSQGNLYLASRQGLVKVEKI